MNNITETKSQKIALLITSGIESWVKAGEILVDMLDNDQVELDQIAQGTGVPAGILGRFEQLGRKQLLPDLLIADYPASKYMQCLPYSEQVRLTKESIEVLTSDGLDKILISSKNLTSNQCRQVFAKHEVRELAGQKAWVESSRRKAATKTVEAGMTYHIEKGQVIFDKGCAMKASQLLNILAQLTPSK